MVKERKIECVLNLPGLKEVFVVVSRLVEA